MKAIATANYDFEGLIKGGYVYVDKTDMLYRLAKRDKDAIYFISRHLLHLASAPVRQVADALDLQVSVRGEKAALQGTEDREEVGLVEDVSGRQP